MKIHIESFQPDPQRAQEILKKELGFGNYFSDRMFTAKFSRGQGWHDAKIGPFENFSLSPAAAVFHYGQAIFEGQKAYAREDGEVQLFRPQMNAKRMAASAQRLVMPPFPEELYLDALDRLIDLERKWVPTKEQQSLYIRPFMIATEALQGVRPADEYLFSIILSPVGAYYPRGFEPVRILVSDDLVRASRGGMGTAKAAGNYAGSLLAGTQAHDAGCDQVLWLDAIHRRYVEEIGAMNFMVVIDDKLITPPLAGSILPGVTRDTVLELAREQGREVEERPMEIDEVLGMIQQGRCKEAFGCGTAAVITSIASLHYRGEEVKLSQAPGPVAEGMFKTISDIQWGRIADTHGWIHQIPRR